MRERAELKTAESSALDVFVLTFACTFPTLMAWLQFMGLAGEELQHNPAVQSLFVAGKVVQFSLPLLYLWLICGQRVSWTWPDKAGVRLGVSFGLFVAAGIALLYFGWLKHTPLMEETAAKVHAWLTTMNLASPVGFLVMSVFVAVLHSFLEEYYWRWFVFGRLRRHVPLGAAIAISSLAFMSHHVIVLAAYFPGAWRFWAGVVPFSLCVAGGGVVWAWLYQRTNSIYGPWLSHMIVDIALMGLGLDMLASRF